MLYPSRNIEFYPVIPDKIKFYLFIPKKALAVNEWKNTFPTRSCHLGLSQMTKKKKDLDFNDHSFYILSSMYDTDDISC